MPSTQKPKRHRSWPLLTALTTLSLSGCGNAPTVEGCPPEVKPTRCVADWYAASSPPECFDQYMDKIERQQCLLAGRKDCDK